MEADGTIACSYHGWRFNGAGKCTTIPQVRVLHFCVARVFARTRLEPPLPAGPRWCVQSPAAASLGSRRCRFVFRLA